MGVHISRAIFVRTASFRIVNRLQGRGRGYGGTVMNFRRQPDEPPLDPAFAAKYKQILRDFCNSDSRTNDGEEGYGRACSLVESCFQCCDSIREWSVISDASYTLRHPRWASSARASGQREREREK